MVDGGDRWSVGSVDREAMLARQIKIAKGEDDDAGPKEQIAAFKAILAAEAQNIADEQKELDRMDVGRNRILDLLGRSSAGPCAIVIESGGKAITNGGHQSPSQNDTTGEDEGGGAGGGPDKECGISPKTRRSRVNRRDSRAKRTGKKKKAKS